MRNRLAKMLLKPLLLGLALGGSVLTSIPTHALGVTAIPGITFRGTWNSNSLYFFGDVVGYQNQSYIAQGLTRNEAPSPTSKDWYLLAAQGPKGDTGPQGVQGPPGSYTSVAATLTFTFMTRQNTTKTGTWRPFVIGPDQTRHDGLSVDITAASTTVTVTVGPPILIGPYAIVVYNENIANPAGSVLNGSIYVTNSFNSDSTRYNYFTGLEGPGSNQQLFFNPFGIP